MKTLSLILVAANGGKKPCPVQKAVEALQKEAEELREAAKSFKRKVNGNAR